MNSGNIIKCINTCAILLLSYSAVFVNLKRSELQEVNRKTRKYLAMYGGLHPKADVYKQYLPRKRMRQQ